MTLTINFGNEVEAALETQAAISGVSPAAYVVGLVQNVLEEKKLLIAEPKKMKSSYGILKQYGPAPSAEEIDECRAEM